MRLSLSQKVKTSCKIDSSTYAQNSLCFIMLKMRSSMSSWLKFQDSMKVRTCNDSIASVPLGIHDGFIDAACFHGCEWAITRAHLCYTQVSAARYEYECVHHVAWISPLSTTSWQAGLHGLTLTNRSQTFLKCIYGVMHQSRRTLTMYLMCLSSIWCS